MRGRYVLNTYDSIIVTFNHQDGSRRNFFLINYSWGIRAAIWHFGTLFWHPSSCKTHGIWMPSQRFLPISSFQISPHLRRCDKMRGRGIGRNGAIETSETTEPGMSDWQLGFPNWRFGKAKSKGWLGFSLTSGTDSKLAEDAISIYHVQIALMLQT